MCKKPGSVCQVQDHDVPAGDDLSDDETDPSDTDDSFMSDSTSYAGGSDSEVGSASGNRITPNMVMYHMMKERGLMTEEHYREKQDNSVNDESIKIVAPANFHFCRSDDSCNDNSFSFDSDDDDDLFDLSLIGTPCCNMFKPADIGRQHTNEVNNDASNKSEDAVEPSIDNETACGNDDTVENALKHEEKIKSETTEEVTLSGKEESNSISETIKDSLSCIERETYEDNSVNMDKNESLKETHDDDIENIKVLVGSASEAKSNPDVAKEAEVNRSIVQGTTTSELKNNNDKAGPEKDIEMDGNATAKDDNACGDKTEMKTNEGVSGKITESIKSILEKMMYENRILGEHFIILQSYEKSLDEFYDCNRAVHKFSEPGEGPLLYQHELLREFAIFLNYYSPSAYEYIRQTFITPLPNHRILSSWYLHSDDSPGLSKRAFEVLKRKAAGKRLLCSLMSHGFFLVNLADKYDQVDYGGGCNHKYTEKAMVAFVFVLVSLEENWKIPIGYVFAQSVPPESHAGLIRVCLSQCHEVGVDVVAVTLETPSPAEFLGCSFTDVNNLKTTFKHPECDRDVAVWIDPCLALRSVHYTLKSKSVLYNNDNDKIRWALIRKLRRLYSKNPINFQMHFSPPYMKLRNHVAKVGLTTDIFSESLVKTLSLCQGVQPDRFRNITPTQQFIENVNKLFDILNSTLTDGTGHRRAVDVNSTNLFPILDELKAYIIGIFSKDYNGLSRLDNVNLDQKLQTRSFVAGDPVCGFVSFLICIESLKHLYNSLIKTGKLTQLATHRLCKDHVEDFVKKMRYSEKLEAKNFTGTAFKNYYNKLHLELSNNARLSDRNVYLDYCPIENQRKPHDEIKYTSGKRIFDEDYSFQYKPKKMPKTFYENRSTNILRAYSIKLDKESDQAFRKNTVAYLAGWIATKFSKCIKCEVCVDALTTDKKLWFHKFITLKEIKGMCYPSEELFRICWECERVLKSGDKRPQLRTFGNLLGRFPWTNLGKHHPLHHIHLVRAIILRYIPLRIECPLTERENNRMIQMLGLMNCVHAAERSQNEN